MNESNEVSDNESADNKGAEVSSNLKILPAFLMCFFLGCLGIHRFYTGRIVSGIFQLLTLGGLGIWAFVDLILIGTGNFKDKQGHKLTQWT